MKKGKIAIVFLFIVMVVSFFSGCAVKMPVPKTKEARFDFSVTYQIHGEVNTYKGVFVCKYEGVCVSLVGKNREWIGYLENESLETGVAIHTNSDGVIYLECGFNPAYLMADPDCMEEPPKPFLILSNYNEETGETTLITDEEELFERYGVKVISYLYPEPIENSYANEWTFGDFEFSIN